MRSAVVLPWLTLGGTEIAAVRFAKAAARAGHSCELIFPVDGGAAVELARREGFETLSHASPEPSLRRPLPFLAASLRLARRLRGRRIDVVHGFDVLGARTGALAGRLSRAAVVGHVLLAQKWLSRVDRLLLRPVQLYVFQSRITWDSFALRVPERRGLVLHDGYSPSPDLPVPSRADARAAFGLPADAWIVGMAARIAPQKDFETLIRAAEIVRRRRPDARFLIAGDHDADPWARRHFATLLPLLRTTGTTDAFSFAGFQSDVRPFFAAIDVFALSTHWEGMPLVILEAMAHRKPIVASAVDAVPEAIEHGVTGLLVPPGDPQALAAALLSLADDPLAAERLASAAERAHEARFSERAYDGRVRALYERIAAGG